MMHQLTLADIEGEVIAFIAVAGSMIIALVSIVAHAIRAASMTRQREQSRREIAAYIAEGSMSPDEGERLLNAGAVRDKMRV